MDREVFTERISELLPARLFAAVFVLLMSVGAAATWERGSMTDFINRDRGVVPEDEWKDIASGFEPVSIRGMLADAVIREAVFDGFTCHMVVEVWPHDPHCFLIPYGAHMLEERAHNAVRAFPKMLDRQVDKLMVRMDLLPTEKHGLPTHMQAEVSVQLIDME